MAAHRPVTVPSPDELHTAARELADRLRVAVFPIRGKAPLADTHGHRDASIDPAAIDAMDWSRATGVGIACGAVSDRLLVIDADGEAGRESLAALDGWPTRATDAPPEVITGRGAHVWLRVPAGLYIPPRSIGIAPGLDLCGEGGYVIAPPSWHPSGARYAWATDHMPSGIPEATGDLLRALDGMAQRRDTARVGKDSPAGDDTGLIPEGERNSTLTSFAGTMRRRGMSRDAIRAALMAENAARCNPPLRDREVDTIAGSVSRYPPAPPARTRTHNRFARASTTAVDERTPTATAAPDPLAADFPAVANQLPEPCAARELVHDASPLRLAERYLDARAHRGVPTIRRWRATWYLWTAARGHYASVPDEVVEADVVRWLDTVDIIERGKNGEHERPLRVALRLAREIVGLLPSRGLIVDGDAPQWLSGADSRPPVSELIVTPRQIIHLPTGRSLSPTPELFTTAGLAVDVDETAAPREWLQFLSSVWPDDREAIATLQQWMGYLLVGDTRQQKALMLIGPTRSGKGTIARVLLGLLGEGSAIETSASALGQRFAASTLIDRTLAIISDMRLSPRADHIAIVELLLAVIGEDRVLADRKGKDPVSVRLPTRIMICANELPRLADTSGALVARCIVAPMHNSFLDREDLNLERRLRAELPRILAWAIDGWRELWQAGRFAQPSSGAELVRELRDLASPTKAFVDQVCAIGQSLFVERGALYEAYREWCDDRGFRPRPETTFARDLRAVVPRLGERRLGPRDSRVRYHVGICIRDDDERDD